MGKTEDILNLDDEVKQVWAKYDANELVDAEALCRRLLLEFPNEFNIHYLLGHIFLKQEKYEEAFLEFQLALKKDTDKRALGYTHYWIGKLHEAYTFEGKNPYYDRAKAKKSYLAAKDCDNYPLDTIYRVHFSFTNNFERIRLYDSALEKFPKEAALDIYKSRAYINLKDNEKALTTLLVAYEKNLGSASLCFNLAQQYFISKDYLKSIELLVEALDLNKEYPSSSNVLYYCLANCYFEIGDLLNSEVYYKKAFYEVIDDNRCWFGFSGLFLIYEGTNRIKDLENLIHEINISSEVYSYCDITDGYPFSLEYEITDYIGFHQNVKDIYSKFKLLTFSDTSDIFLGKLWLTKELFSRESRSTPSESLKFLKNALKYLSHYDYEFLYTEIASLYSDLISSKISKKQSISSLVTSLIRDLDNFPTKLKDESVYVFKDLVNHLFEHNKYDEILKLKKYYNDKHIDEADVWFKIAYSFAEAKDNIRAKAAYEKELAINGDSSSVLNNLAVIYGAEENYAKAIELYQKAIDTNPQDDFPKRNLKAILVKHEKHEQEKQQQLALEKHYKAGLKNLINENNFVLDKLQQFIANAKKEKDFKNWIIPIPKYKFPILIGTDKQRADSLREQWINKYYITELDERTEHNVAFYSINPLLETEILKIDNNKIPENWINGFNEISIKSLENIGYFEIMRDISKANKKFKPLLVRDFNELVFNYLLRNEKATIVLSGSLIELILIYYYEKKKVFQIQYNDARGSLKNKKLYDSELFDLITYAEVNRLFGSDFHHLGNLSRLYRNYIHPGRELKGKLDKAKCDLCFISTIEIIKKII